MPLLLSTKELWALSGDTVLSPVEGIVSEVPDFHAQPAHLPFILSATPVPHQEIMTDQDLFAFPSCSVVK